MSWEHTRPCVYKTTLLSTSIATPFNLSRCADNLRKRQRITAVDLANVCKYKAFFVQYKNIAVVNDLFRFFIFVIYADPLLQIDTRTLLKFFFVLYCYITKCQHRLQQKRVRR